MKKNSKYLPIFIGAAILVLIACNDPTVIGSDLLSDEELNIEFTDTVTFNTYTAKGDSVLLFSTESGIYIAYDNFPFGTMTDPIFGTSTSAVYAQVSRNGNEEFKDNETVDSVVLVLPYNRAGFYGDTSEMFAIRVWEMDEDFPDSISLYSDQTFNLKPDPIGEKTFLPKASTSSEDSVMVFFPNFDSTFLIEPQLRVVLTDAFKDRIFSKDSLNFENDAAFQDFFNGFYLEPISVNNGIVSFNLREDAFDSYDTGIKVYYHNDTASFEKFFPVFESSTAVTANYSNDYAGSPVEPFIGKGTAGADSLVFVQGMAGVSTIVEFPFLTGLGDIVVNQAILEFPIVTMPGDNKDLFFPAEQLIVRSFDIDGNRTVIDEIRLARDGRLNDVFGGNPENGMYKLNISSFLQNAIQGLTDNRIEITINSKPENASRVVLAGPGNSDRPAKLKLTYTRF